MIDGDFSENTGLDDGNITFTHWDLNENYQGGPGRVDWYYIEDDGEPYVKAFVIENTDPDGGDEHNWKMRVRKNYSKRKGLR